MSPVLIDGERIAVLETKVDAQKVQLDAMDVKLDTVISYIDTQKGKSRGVLETATIGKVLVLLAFAAFGALGTAIQIARIIWP